MPRSPQDVAKDILLYFSEGIEPAGLFTDPYTAWHCYDGIDKITRPRLLNVGQPTPESSERPKNLYERVETYGAEGAVTCLLTSKLTMADGRVVRLHSCMVHYLNEANQVYRVEAYYDPHQLERDSWYREHLKMYQGVAGGQNPHRP